MISDPFQYSLEDFYIGENQNPLIPPEDFTEWLKAGARTISLYEPKLHGAAMPRVQMESDGKLLSVINFTSYNYLGLNKHPETIAAAQAALLEYGTGACGSPLLCGMTDLHAKFEEELSSFLGTESTIVYTSGYIAALAALSAVLRRGDVAIADSKMHMSAVEGVRLSRAKLATFEHNDPQSLAQCLDQHKGKRRLVLLEGLYSMDGDFPRLPELLDVTESHGVDVFLDEAHSILTCGPRGAGAAEHFGVASRIGLKYTSLSKSFAALGGGVSGSQRIMDYVRMYGNGYGFSVALPASVIASLRAALTVGKTGANLRERLWSNGQYLRTKLNEIGVDTGRSASFIVPIMIGSDRKLMYDLCHQMRRRGLFLPPVDYPVVPQDQIRFRASVTAMHTREDIDEALNIIEDTVVRALGKRT
ncbi:MAG TPA: aminotransferase class I/II-fold pyridoxal phosphate-dependent enzyme [Terriglobia bacterium]|nr:aminotransferase class I/II-fold pyridoxal phosphate-dependent enzyme [Terriglobia bacterium]